MGVAIYTCTAAISIYDPDTQRWGGYTVPKNLAGLEITTPEPTKIQDFSSMPDDTFAALRDQKLIPKGQATVKLSTTDLVNNASTPREFKMLAIALGAKVSALSSPATSDSYFTAFVDQLELNFPMGPRNIDPASVVVHKEVADTITGLHTGTIASVNTGVYTVTGAGWTADALVGKKLMVTAGTGKGQVVSISDNDATTITATFSPVLDATSQFAIVEPAALTKDTDFTVDAKYGTICPLSIGSVDAEDILHGFCDSFAITGTRYRGSVVTDVRFRLRGKAKDIISGAEGWLEIPEISAYSSQSQQFVASAESPEFKKLELTGDILVADGHNEPYTFDDGLVYATS